MSNKDLIIKLKKVFKKDPAKKQSEKDIAKKLESIRGAIEDYYNNDDEDIGKALVNISDLFEKLSRTTINDRNDDSQKYIKSVESAYFLKNDTSTMLKKFLPDDSLFTGLKSTFEGDSGDYSLTLKKIENILKSLETTAKFEEGDYKFTLPAVICYLLKLENRIDKYNKKVAEAERLEGASEDLETLSDLESEYEKSSEDKPQKNDDKFVEQDVSGSSELIKKFNNIERNINNIESLDDYAANLREIAEIAANIHSATQDSKEVSWVGKIVRNTIQRAAAWLGIDTANLVTISEYLNNIAGAIEQLTENSMPDELRSINNTVDETIKLINAYRDYKIKGKALSQEKDAFVKAISPYLEKIKEIINDSSNKEKEIAKEVNKQADAISKKINNLRIENVSSKVDCIICLKELASIASEIRSASQTIEGNSYWFWNYVNSALTKVKDMGMKIKNATGNDLNSMTNISNELDRIAREIAENNFDTFKNDVANVIILIDQYKDKSDVKQDSFTEVRKEFMNKAPAYLELINSAMNEYTPEERLNRIVNDFLTEINGISVEKNQIPSKYAKDLNELANIALRLREQTQIIRNHPDWYKTAANTAESLLNFCFNEDLANLINISKKFQEIVHDIPHCTSNKFDEAINLLNLYVVKKSIEKGDVLKDVRKAFVEKAEECLKAAKEVTTYFTEVDNSIKNKSTPDAKYKERIESIIKTNIKNDNNEGAEYISRIVVNFIKGGSVKPEVCGQKLVTNIAPPAKGTSTLLKAAKDFSIDKLEKSGSPILGFAGKAINLIPIGGVRETFRGNVMKCFKKIEGMGSLPEKCEDALKEIDKSKPEEFSGLISDIEEMGNSYSKELNILKADLGTLLDGFYGCTISDRDLILSPEKCERWTNIFKFFNLFSNAVSLYCNFNKYIILPVKNCPYECLKDAILNENLEKKEDEKNKKAEDWKIEKEKFELYNDVKSYKKELGVSPTKDDDKENPDLINEKVFNNEGIPQDDKKFSDGVSGYLNTIGTKGTAVKGFFSKSTVTTYSINKENSSKNLKENIYLILCACENEMKRREFNNYDKFKHDNFLESYDTFINNYEYLVQKLAEK